jgi:hypothetical protein
MFINLSYKDAKAFDSSEAQGKDIVMIPVKI